MSESWMDWIKNGNLEQYRSWLFSNSSQVNASNPEGVPAVRFALYYGKPDIAEMLVEMGAELDLFSAAALGKRVVLEERIASAPEMIHVLSTDGYPALGLACFFNHADCVEFLLEHGADVNQSSENAQHVMPIHAATAVGSVTITAMLLERGADANARQSGGFTPLHTAAQNGDIEMARLLMQYGGDPTLANEAGHTPIDLARNNHSDELVNLFSHWKP